jgi:broad specificity phosphatase PhoE
MNRSHHIVHFTYFVHATTVDNEKGMATGWLHGELSELGWRQAEELRLEVASQIFDAVICSDLKRAVDTAEIAFGQRYLITKDARLREINYGDWNGRSHQPFVGSMEDYIRVPFPNGESYRDVEERMRGLSTELKAKFNGGRVALLAHQAPQLALEVIGKGKTWQEAIDQDWRRSKSYRPGWRYTL